LKLIDFQIAIGPSRLDSVERKNANIALFPYYEAVHLWLSECRIDAPFRKLLVTLVDMAIAPQMHGVVTSVLGICEVAEAVEDPLGNACSGNGKWIATNVRNGLLRIEQELGWASDALMERVHLLSDARPPCAHRFKKLHRKLGKIECDLWLIAEVGRTAVTARFTLGGREVLQTVILEKPGPLWLDYEFPVKSATVRDGAYVLLDRDKKELARLSVPL